MAGADATFQWIDLKDPTKAQLEEAARTYGLHPLLVQDVLEPDHLPKVGESPNPDEIFIILRVFDRSAKTSSTTVRQLTRKISVFSRPGLLVTIHRADFAFLNDLRSSLEACSIERSSVSVLSRIVKHTIFSFQPPLEEAERALERLEARLLAERAGTRFFEELHGVRRRLASFKRLLWHTKGVLQSVPMPKTVSRGDLLVEDLRESAESLLFRSDELTDEATSLLNLSLSVQSHRTNEVMRVLTLFSALFLPLTFIVGVYGMNFKHMPELDWFWGYGFVWIVMLSVTATILLWFRRRGWVNRWR
jgi:magnesium transporter